MRILHTIHSVQPSVGGPAQTVPRLVSALREAGTDAWLWTFNRCGPADLLADPTSPQDSLAQALERLEKVDAIHDHGVWLGSNRLVARVATAAGIARIVSPRGMLEARAMRHHAWRKRIAWMVYQRRNMHSAAALHATVEHEAEGLRELGLSQPTVVIANGIDLPSGDPVTKTARPLRTAVFLGRVHPIKGLPDLVEAWRQVAPAGWQMRIVGPDEGGHSSEVKSLVSAAGVGRSWKFDGAVDNDQKWQILREADLFIMPTKTENFGLSIAEALACRLPVITTEGAPWRGLTEHRCGWWVKSSAGALAGALEEAISLSPEQRASMGDRGRAWMASDFSWKDIGRQMTRAYDEILTAST